MLFRFVVWPAQRVSSPQPKPAMARRPADRYRWVQESLTIAFRETIKAGDANILDSMGRRLIALAAQVEAGLPVNSNEPSLLNEMLSADGHDGPSKQQAAPNITRHWKVERWLAAQNVASTLAECIIERSTASDELSALQSLATHIDPREEVHRRLKSGLELLTDSLLPGLAELAAHGGEHSERAARLLPGGGALVLKEAAVPLPGTVSLQGTAHPKLLVVGAINVDVTAHVRGSWATASTARAASTTG